MLLPPALIGFAECRKKPACCFSGEIIPHITVQASVLCHKVCNLLGASWKTRVYKHWFSGSCELHQTDRYTDRSRISGTFPYSLLSALVPLIVSVECVKMGQELPLLVVWWCEGFPSCSEGLAALWEALHCDSGGQSHWRSRTPSLPLPVLMLLSSDLPSFPLRCSINFSNKSSKYVSSHRRWWDKLLFSFLKH